MKHALGGGCFGGIMWVNVGHSAGTPVQRAASATWMLLVKMATVWVFSLSIEYGGCGFS